MSDSYVQKRFSAGYAHYVTPVEAGLMRRLGWLRDYPWLTASFKFVSRLGDGPLWGAVGITLLLLGGTPERLAVAAAALAAMAAVGLFSLLKHLIRRPRPFERWSDLSCLLPPPDRFSFPSGHTLTAFAMYGSLGSLVPTLVPLLLTSAVLIGLSRVYLGAHYPTDVLVGGLLGTLLGRGIAWGCDFLFI
ncbi:MAG: phosphatase PAP2 family protein [Pedobacter sp.]|jgi:undecaprenyl-diphosphatase